MEPFLATGHKVSQQRGETLGWIEVDARLNNLRSDPRFGDIVRRLEIQSGGG